MIVIRSVLESIDSICTLHLIFGNKFCEDCGWKEERPMAEYVDYSNGRQNYRQHSYTGDGSWERTTHETDAYQQSMTKSKGRK